METSEDADAGVPMSSLNSSNGAFPFHDTNTSQKKMLSPSQTSNQNEMCGQMISPRQARKRSAIQPKTLSPGRAPPLPCTGGFRLQPRKNILNLASQTPTPRSSVSSRGRKRGAQTMVSALGSPSVGSPQAIFTATTSNAINLSNETFSDELKSLPRRQNDNSVPNSPISVHHAMQSMTIRTPTPSTPSLKESPSPFIVFSPSLKSCPYRQRPRSESFCSVDSSTKPPSSVVTGTRVAPIYGSPRRKINCNNNYNSNNDILSTPRSHCNTANASQAPATPASIRTLPSPHATPLPRSMRLTPRSRRNRDELSSETSIFLSPNEKLDHASTGEEGIPIFSFEGGVESRLRASTRTPSYVPSPFSCSRMSVTPRTSAAVSSFVGESGGSLRVETRSLLGTQDSTSTLDYIISANARIAAQDCDDSLSDDSDEPFVLANPIALAQERDAMTMPPPRPSRRRRMSTASISESTDATTPSNDNETSTQNNVDFANEKSRDMHPNSGAEIHCQMEDMVSNHGDKKFNPNSDLRQTQSSDVRKSINSRYDHKYSGRLQPIESCCSLVGLGLAESSSMMDSNTEPTTPPTKLDALYDATPPRTPSKSSVFISQSDADNVHLTIANMAVLHQNLSPTLTTCNS